MASGGSHQPTKDLFTALAHPVRRRILRKLIEDDAEVSPLELSTQLSEQLSALSYHVRVLAECKAVRLVRTRQIRGSTQHFYRLNLKAEWARSALKTTRDRPKKNRSRGEEKS